MASYNKKELEKKKQSKKLEKQKRKDERKAEGTKSFDDMIAYVDENGVITDTPPDLTNVQKVDLESINISTPKQAEVAAEPLKGRVDFYNSDRGYGFIKNQSGNEKYFFHINSAPENIAEGDIVTYELERGPKGMNAVNIAFVEK